MRRVLPGGAILGERNHEGNEREVACRPRAAVLESISRLPPEGWLLATLKLVLHKFTTFWQWLLSPRGLLLIKRLLEVLAVLVGLIGAVLALLGWSRR